MNNTETKEFIAYEYLSVNIKSIYEPLYIDCYENFGWILINNSALLDKEDYFINAYNYSEKRLVNIKFKRDRKIKNKVKLIPLQRKVESSLKEIEKLENQPTMIGLIYALTIGFIGTVFLSISVFTITASSPLYIIGTILGIIGLIGWILPYFIYKHTKDLKEKENIPLIDEQYNIIYDTCKQAKKLIN